MSNQTQNHDEEHVQIPLTMIDEQKERNTQDHDEEEHVHIPLTMLDEQQGRNTGTGGLLSYVGDPVGNGLATVLRPVGAALETCVTGPVGNLVGGATRGTLGPFLGNENERIEVLGGKSLEEREEGGKGFVKELGGNKQTGRNPLGLNDT